MVSAADVITYAGVPLAVLGVLPSLYTFVRSLVTLRDVRRTLDHNRVPALTRGSMLSGIIEVEMPRKSITPLEREDAQYFELNASHAALRGGSWTLFNWRELVIGVKIIRLQYHDELVVPQAEIELESLVAFLMDRGAQVDKQGWGDLRSSGLWTPVGTRLLTAPDGSGRAALSVSGSEDSEGLLSMRMEWDEEWNTRNYDDLPPYWMSLQGPENVDTEDLGILPKENNDDADDKTEATSEDQEPENSQMAAEEKNEQQQQKISNSASKRNSVSRDPSDGLLHAPPANEALASHIKQQPFNAHKYSDSYIELHPRERGLSNASRISRVSVAQSLATIALTHAIQPGPLRIRLSSSGVDMMLLPTTCMKFRPRHLRQFRLAEGSNSSALWFCSAATALGAPRGGLWAFSVPTALTSFAQIDSIPAGVMELWGLMAPDQTPVWQTPVDSELEDMEARQRERVRGERLMAEMHLRGAERQEAVMKRMRDEWRDRQFEQERRELAAQARKARLQVEALGSVRLNNRVVGEACRKWLIAQGRIGKDVLTTAAVAEKVLWEMAVKENVAKVIAKILDTWKHVADHGGMTKADHDLIKENLVPFAYAACIVSIIADSAEALDGAMVSDLQECIRLWRRIRLG